MSVEPLHDCPDCDCYVEEVKPTPQTDWEGWVEDQRQQGLAAVNRMFRPLRMRVGLATLGDLMHSIYENQILEQLGKENFLARRFCDSQD